MEETSDVVKFGEKVREATRDVHSKSDMLVNAKFALALKDNTVWANGLMAFHEIYKFFEKELPEDLLPKEFHRTESFNRDIEYYLGKDWKNAYVEKQPVKEYLKYLEQIKDNKMLLFAFAFQMYMALISGGQILQKKRMLANKLKFLKGDDGTKEGPPPGCEATWFQGHTAKDLREKLKNIFYDNCKDFDEDMKQRYIEESRTCFMLNNEIIRTIEGVHRFLFGRVIMVVGIFVTVLALAVRFNQ